MEINVYFHIDNGNWMRYFIQLTILAARYLSEITERLKILI